MTFQTNSAQSEQQKSPNIIFEGVFTTGRGPCELLLDGSRRWRLINGFTISSVTVGEVNVKYIEVNLYDYKTDKMMELTEGKTYKVALNLNENQLKKIAQVHYGDDAITMKEIIEINSLEKE